MARTTPISMSAACSMAVVRTDAAIDISSFFGVSAGRIWRTTSGTVIGLSPIRIRSADCAAATLSVDTSTPHCAESCPARSSCSTVATICSGSSTFDLRKAWSRIPPIFPAPRMATFRPASGCPVVNPPMISPLLLCFLLCDPAVDALLQVIQRQSAGIQYLIVEGAQVELGRPGPAAPWPVAPET